MTTFITGFPGFLGSALVDRLVAETPASASITCLVQPTYREFAKQRVETIEARHGTDGAINLVEGDITEPDLGLGDRYRRLQDETTAAFHLAAVYDLGVDQTLARRVNVEGTRHVLGFLEAAPDFECLQYVSTCYVSGRYDGRFGPDDLLVGQRFNNHYEATKFQAEVAVRTAMARGLPATIYRPSVVVGDSESGATAKYDGPYQVIRFLLRSPSVALVPVVGDPRVTELNVVPRDFVIAAIDTLRRQPGTVGETYQLADPDPPTVAEVLDMVAAATGRRLLRLPIPRSVLKATLRHVPGASRTGIQPELVDYFDLPTRYDASKTTDALAEAGVSCPPFRSYVDSLVAYVRANPEVRTGPMA